MELQKKAANLLPTSDNSEDGIQTNNAMKHYSAAGAGLILEDIDLVRNKIKSQKPLIHCITNPISINDCANIVLATGAKPIMAEHPLEVAQITSMAKALAVNLGNITDARMQSIMISGKQAKDSAIPSIIDVVGVTCSKLRLNLAKQFIQECSPSVIKGNYSEIKVLAGIQSDAVGIDVSEHDTFSEEDTAKIEYAIKNIKQLATQTGAVIVASGKIDIISDGHITYLIHNGCEMLGDITGTGCMLNVLIASYLSESDALHAAMYATAILGIAGELSNTDRGTGTFHVNLLDMVNTIDTDTLVHMMRIEKVEI